MIRRLLCIALFLLAQAGALAHGIGHLSDPDRDGSTPDPVCELCMAFAPLGAGLASKAPACLPPTISFRPEAEQPGTFVSRFQFSYRSRAPPGG